VSQIFLDVHILIKNCIILCLAHLSIFFFFSSRRRHTRSYGDWSSDVCSSDLSTRRKCRACGRNTGRRSIRIKTKRPNRAAPRAQRTPQTTSEQTLPGSPLYESTLHLSSAAPRFRSEERRVGKECRSRWWTDHE